jgi:hypothetical protein
VAILDGGIIQAMRRRLAALLVLNLVALSTARSVLGALDIAVSVSPEQGTVGRPVEIMVRTFEPIGVEGVALPVPTLAYPVPSGLWDVLYPISDYPFDVVATPETGASVPISLSRDARDASLWRGSFTPMTGGQWFVSVRNFPNLAPISLPISRSTEMGSDGWVAILMLVGGLVVGLVLGRRTRTNRQAIS